ncbi:MAG TPA: hypothetical protein VIF62_38340 [Labilithrix sp.]|jgi:hypothetical protein
MNRVLPCLFAALLLACSAETTDSASEAEDLRSNSFDLRQPFSGARMEKLRKALSTIDDEGSFVRNYHRSAGVHFQRSSHAALTDAERAQLVSSAYTWWTHFEDPSANEHVRDLVVQTDGGKALDAIGLEVDVEDARSDAARAALEKTLATVAATRDVTVYTAVLPKEDMSWHDLLAVVDEDEQEILFETGGYGN